jgi:hypothetical protein
MGLLDFLKVKEYQKRIAELESMLRPEHQDILTLNSEIQKLRITVEIEKGKILEFTKQKQQEIIRFEEQADIKRQTLSNLESQITTKNAQIVKLDEEIMIQEFGVYTPLYTAMESEAIKSKLLDIREKQKDMIKADKACNYFKDWTVNGSKAEGLKMAKNNVKQILRSFNTECESIIDKVKFSNLSAISERITKSCEALNKMNTVNKVSINDSYLNLKQLELRLVYEYAQQKEKEKEDERQRREELREQKKLEQEIKKAKEKIKKEQNHFENAIEELKLKLESSVDEIEIEKLRAKITDLETKLEDVNKQMVDIDYRERNTRAGYVYVISNIGAFGENTFKIGVTRRLDPMERIKELGDASVPFKFDVHCLVFSEDAPTFENKLHQTFENFRINCVNTKREFFRVPLQQIEAVIRTNYNDTFDMKHIPDAEEFRISEKVRLKIIKPEDVLVSNENVEDNDSYETDEV